MTNTIKLFLIVQLVALTTGCANTQLVKTWHDSKYEGSRFSDIMVMGIGNEDRNIKTFEIEFTKHLLAAGPAAVPATDVITDVDRKNVKAIVDKVKERKFDAVLVTRFISVDKSYTPVAPTTTSARYNSFGTYYTGAYNSVWHSNQMIETTTLTLETVLYRVENESIVWSAVTKTFNPTPKTLSKNIEELAQLVVKELTKTTLIK